MKEYVHEPKDEAYFHKLIQECHRERQQTSQGALPATTVDKKAHCITPTAPLVEVPHISAQENFRFADSSVPPQMHRKDGLHARNKNFSPPKPDQIKKKCRRNPLSTISSNDLLLNRTNNMRSGDLLKNMPYPEHLRGLMVENAPIPQSHNRTASDPFITPIQPYARQKTKLNKKAESNISKRPDSHKFKTKVQPVPPSLHTQQRKAVRKRNINDKGKRYAHNSTEGIKIVKCGVASPASTDQLPNQDFDSDVSDFYSDKGTYSNTRKEVESISRKLDFDLNQKDSSTSEQFHDLEYSYIADMCSDQSDGDSEDDYADDINYETYEVLEKAKKVFHNLDRPVQFTQLIKLIEDSWQTDRWLSTTTTPLKNLMIQKMSGLFELERNQFGKSSRIHGFIASQICPKFEDQLYEGQIYILQNFSVKEYNGDETSRSVGIKFPTHSFDIRNLDEVDAMKGDNRFLNDFAAVVEGIPQKNVYTKDDVERSHVSFTITDGRKTQNVTFFNEFGDFFLDAFSKIEDKPVVIIICCAKVTEWKGVVYLTNFPATRFYLNIKHVAVTMLKERYHKPDFYVMDIDDDDVSKLEIKKVNELRKLNESYIQKMNWFSPFCLQCEKDIKLADGSYQCCGRSIPFRLYSLCSDSTGTVAIVWPDEEICRLTGKTVYDVDAEEIEVNNKEMLSNVNSPPTEKSTNRTRSRLPEEKLETSIKPPKFKNIKVEKQKMATSNCETLRNVTTGRTDWKVKVRIIRIWRGSTLTGVPFKGFNLLFLDSKSGRMHAWVPAALSDKMERLVEEGKLYLIKNFQVQNYEEKAKYRAVQMDRQIVFTADTKLKEIEETDIFIPKNSFDLYEYADLKKVADQDLYLTDVLGFIQKMEGLSRNASNKVKLKFKITDGRKTINVTLWDAFAEAFEKDYMKENLEQPVIVIIASGRVTKFRDQLDICNYSPTKIYINYEHHSVARLRKMLKDPNFNKVQMPKKKKPAQVCTISEVQNASAQFIQEEVICKATIISIETTEIWNQLICTSCYRDTQMENNKQHCKYCSRIVPHPLKRFHVTAIAQDDTGDLKIILKDREIRNLIHKYVEELETEDNSFPKKIKDIEGSGYTIKLLITSRNVEKRDLSYIATDIVTGYNYIDESVQQKDSSMQTSTSVAEPSGSSIQLDEISQLDYATQ
ncbi:hypothetical protein ACET3Z_015376 [Daucus carota]